MSSLLDRLKKTSTIKETEVLQKSVFFNKKDVIPTRIPLINMALSGDFDGGITPGVTMLCGQSKSFKTGFALIMAQAYLDRYKDAVLLFIDSEFGSPQTYFEANNIDTSRVLHVPVVDLEEMRHELTVQLNEIKRGDKVVIVIDSIGNIASKKEADDALEGKSVADMSRAKMMKSLFRIATPHLSKKDIPLICVNHTYAEMGLYPREIVSGGRGAYYAADNIWIISRSQEKDGTDIVGYNFTINVEKSRHVKEKSKLPVQVMYEGGVNKFSGLLDIALELGYAAKPKNGWYALVDKETGEISEKNVRYTATQTEEFLGVILNNPSFRKDVTEKYKLVFERGEVAVDIDVDDDYDDEGDD